MSRIFPEDKEHGSALADRPEHLQSAAAVRVGDCHSFDRTMQRPYLVRMFCTFAYD
jgi:hypothetical protein